MGLLKHNRPGQNAWQPSTGPEASRFHDALSKLYPRANGKSSTTPVYINTPQGRKCAGQLQTVNGHSVFVKHVIMSRHLHRKLDAWGLDESLLNELVRRSVKTIKVITDNGSAELSTVGKYLLKGITMDFGHNKQVFLPRRYFQKSGGISQA